jgi:hypothetical protein
MAISILVFCGLATFPGWHYIEGDDEREVKPFPSSVISQACAIASLFGASLLLISALWQNVAAAATGSTISYTTYGCTKAHVGPVAMVLLWISFLALAVVGLHLLILNWSIAMILKLMEEEEDNDSGDEEMPLRPSKDGNDN